MKKILKSIFLCTFIFTLASQAQVDVTGDSEENYSAEDMPAYDDSVYEMSEEAMEMPAETEEEPSEISE